MAPLITITVQALIGSVGFKQNQGPISKPCHTPIKALGPNQGTSSLSAISWGPNRMDVYGTNANNGALSHKWWDGSQWGPSWNGTEDLGILGITAPVAVSWGTDRMDIFSRGVSGDVTHKYWDGTAWKPDVNTFESLGGSLDLLTSQLAATSWGPGRLDVFGINSQNSSLQHKYFDGSQWNPSGGLEDLGGELSAGVSAVSWGEDRLDVFAVDDSASLVHIYYDGTKWSDWEDLDAPIFASEFTATSWGKNRLDVFGVSHDAGELWHTAWDGSQWLAWESLGGSNLVGPVAANSWGVNRTDIVALGQDGSYYYKYWDGSQWNPIEKTLFPKGGDFTSLPAVVSWGVNRLDIYGVTSGQQLGHQTWYGSGWYPEWGFEQLGGTLSVNSVDAEKYHKEL